MDPIWIPCPDGCDDWWCTLHQKHTHECPCPPVDRWAEKGLDPYTLTPEQYQALGSPLSRHPWTDPEDFKVALAATRVVAKETTRQEALTHLSQVLPNRTPAAIRARFRRAMTGV